MTDHRRDTVLSISPTNDKWEVVYVTKQGLMRQSVDSKDAAEEFIQALPDDALSERFIQRRNSVATEAKKLKKHRSKTLQLRTFAMLGLSAFAAVVGLLTAFLLTEADEISTIVIGAIISSVIFLGVTNFFYLAQSRTRRKVEAAAADQKDFVWAVRAWAATSTDMPIVTGTVQHKIRATDLKDRNLEKI